MRSDYSIGCCDLSPSLCGAPIHTVYFVLASLIQLKDSCVLCLSLPGKMGRECCPPGTPAPNMQPGTTSPPCQPSESPILSCLLLHGVHAQSGCSKKQQDALLLPENLQAPGPQSSCLCDGNNFLNRRPFQLSLLGPLQRKAVRGDSKYCQSALTIREPALTPSLVFHGAASPVLHSLLRPRLDHSPGLLLSPAGPPCPSPD